MAGNGKKLAIIVNCCFFFQANSFTTKIHCILSADTLYSIFGWEIYATLQTATYFFALFVFTLKICTKFVLPAILPSSSSSSSSFATSSSSPSPSSSFSFLSPSSSSASSSSSSSSSSSFV